MERDACEKTGKLSDFNFNSHAHVERDDFNGVYGKGTENFNSHAHVERDLRQVLLELSLTISTHTLTWSVTRQEMKKLYMNLHFNSHAHVERDTL